MPTSRRIRLGRAVPAVSAAAVALLLGACGTDSTSSSTDPVDLPLQELTISPQAAEAVKSAVFRASHKLPIVSARTITAPGFSASAADPVSSPFDLTYFGGPVVNAATSFNVYVNCTSDPTTCWGSNGLSPTNFLRDLNRDGFIQMVNEFIGSDAKNHFPVEQMRLHTTFSTPTTASLDDIFSIVFSAAQSTGKIGYGAIYHVFLPQGIDMCIDASTCYSPDNFDTFVFCAFHGSVDFGPNAHVLFSVEPYQYAPGCVIPGQVPHGAIDAQASTLSHELMETITDPDGSAWFNGLFGFEGSDICSALGSNEVIGAHQYFIQKEYSNKKHGCTTS